MKRPPKNEGGHFGLRATSAWIARKGPPVDFTLDSLDVEGEYGLITWRLTFDGGEITFGTDTFHVRDGKIVGHTGAVQLELRD